MEIGMIFPGQGSQFLGMGKELYDQERLIQEFFEEASDCLNVNFVKLCFASSDRELRQTFHAQTSIFLISAAIYSLLKRQYRVHPGIVAGHSSGEFSALFAAEGMNFADVLYLLKKRSLFMEETLKESIGGMVAVLGLHYDIIAGICSYYNDISSNDVVAEIVNYNTPSQVVVSGTSSVLESVCKDLKLQGGRIIPLNVAAPFHSRLMKPAARLFAQYMMKVDFKELKIPFVSNVTGSFVHSCDEMRMLMMQHMSSQVLWWPSMMHFMKCDLIIEIGPDNKLSRMLQREWPDKKIMSINTMQDCLALADIVDDQRRSEVGAYG